MEIEKVTIGEYIDAHGDAFYWMFDLGLGVGSDAVIGLGSHFWNLELARDNIDRNAIAERLDRVLDAPFVNVHERVYTSDGWCIERIAA